MPDVNLFAGGSQNLPMYLFDNLGSYSSIRERVLENFDLKPDQTYRMSMRFSIRKNIERSITKIYRKSFQEY